MKDNLIILDYFIILDNDLGFGNDMLGTTPKARSMKEELIS